MYGNVKLIWTSSFIILTLIPNKETHEQLKLVHKTLITTLSIPMGPINCWEDGLFF